MCQWTRTIVEHMGFLEWAIWGILAPDRFVTWMLLLGSILLVRSQMRWARRCVVGTTAFVFFICLFPVADWLLHPLEQRFPIPDLTNQQLSGIIVLSGGSNAIRTIRQGQPVLTESAERLVEFIGLALRHPEARLVVSDGAWDFEGRPLGAATAKHLFATLMLDSLSVEYEERPTSTRDNAVFSQELVQAPPDERWVLVTSARHLPRSVGAFRKVGWDVLGYPVDFLANPNSYFRFHPANSLAHLSIGLREWIALLVYRARGYTCDLFPGPTPTSWGVPVES